MKRRIFKFFTVVFLLLLSGLQNDVVCQVKDVFTPLPANSVKFANYLEKDIQNSIDHWNKGVVPYAELVQFFRTGRLFFASGEMWGKAVRSGSMMYRYTQDSALKRILGETVKDLLTTQRENGSISCSKIEEQPDGPGGDLWERKYVLLGLLDYYAYVEEDTAVYRALIRHADCIVNQVGLPPKVRIIDQGWSANHIESSTLLEPIMRLYKLTGFTRYLDFAKYIVEVEGGAKGYNIIEQAYNNEDPVKIGGPYPKAYEMMSLFEGLAEYYRITKNERWKTALLNLYKKIVSNEITIIGNGGGDQPYHPKVMGEAWDNTAYEQTNPDIKRMMETCVGVTWLKLCSQILTLTGDPATVDHIEKYIYNGLIGGMKPTGDGFSYVNLLNGVKTNPEGWGTKIKDVHVTCCNLNGPMGLAYIPLVAVMKSAQGTVINLYNAGSMQLSTPGNQNLNININTEFPTSGGVKIKLQLANQESFTIKLRIPAWSRNTVLKVNGKSHKATPGTYLDLNRSWGNGDEIELNFDMTCRLIKAPRGSNRKGDHYSALVAGPIVLTRDENIDDKFDTPVDIIATNGIVNVEPVTPIKPGIRMMFKVPTSDGYIQMIDYSSANSWNGKRVCTWLPDKQQAKSRE